MYMWDLQYELHSTACWEELARDLFGLEELYKQMFGGDKIKTILSHEISWFIEIVILGMPSIGYLVQEQ